MFTIKEEKSISSFYDLMRECWSGALDTLKDIEEADKQEELMDLIIMVFEMDEVIDLTKLNDFLWFDRDYIYEELGLNEEEEDI